jgi:hypothetical protein
MLSRLSTSLPYSIKLASKYSDSLEELWQILFVFFISTSFQALPVEPFKKNHYTPTMNNS